MALLIFLSTMVIPSESFAQMNKKAIKRNNKRISSYQGKRTSFSNRYNFVGLSIHSMNYFGDLSPLSSRASTDPSFTQLAWGLSMARRLGPRYTLQSQFLYGTLEGSDASSASPLLDSKSHSRYLRNLSFQNRIKELSVIAYYDLFANHLSYINRVRVVPYAYLGLALVLHNPKAQVPKTDLDGNVLTGAGEWVSLRSLGTEGQHSKLEPTDANFGIKTYSALIIAIPCGIGSRFRITDLLDVWLEIGFRYTFTDYLDDVSKNYVDLGVLNSPLAKAMSYRTAENGLVTNPKTYQGRDQVWYSVQNGYGQEHPDNIRGNQQANDVYMVSSLRLTHIIPHPRLRAKHR